MELISGNIFIRPNPMDLGHVLAGHEHNFDHTTFFQSGWHLCRRIFRDGTESITQHCSLDYRKIRELQQKHEPENIVRPVRGQDRIDSSNGRRFFNLKFIGSNDPVPSGFEEIIFDPIHYYVLSEAQVIHEFVALSHKAELNCVYSHRDSQGEVVQQYAGFQPAYR